MIDPNCKICNGTGIMTILVPEILTVAVERRYPCPSCFPKDKDKELSFRAGTGVVKKG